MKDKFTKLIDVKSIVTLALIAALITVVIKNVKMDNDIFLLFSNVVTMVITYFFAKQKKDGE